MYALTSIRPNEDLVRYLQHPIIQSIRHDGEKYSFCPTGGGARVVRSGLLSKLKKVFYPDFEYKRRRHRGERKRKGSSRAQGISLDNQVFAYINGKYKKSALRHRYSKALVQYLEDQIGHTLQAAQVPVYVHHFRCVTQADLITQDKEGRLFVWELKTGYNQCQKQGFLTAIPGETIPNNRKNQWELQRHFTTMGLTDVGLKLSGSQVLNIYDETDGKITVRRRKRPTWIDKLKL